MKQTDIFLMEGPTWSNLTEQIKRCKGVFVLKGPNIAASVYTSNWVSWEIGLASSMEKDAADVVLSHH